MISPTHVTKPSVTMISLTYDVTNLSTITSFSVPLFRRFSFIFPTVERFVNNIRGTRTLLPGYEGIIAEVRGYYCRGTMALVPGYEGM